LQNWLFWPPGSGTRFGRRYGWERVYGLLKDAGGPGVWLVRLVSCDDRLLE
jgi:hypothetical protein